MPSRHKQKQKRIYACRVGFGLPHHPHRKKLQQKSQQKEDTGEGIRTWMQIGCPASNKAKQKARCHVATASPRKKSFNILKIKNLEGKGKRVWIFLKEKRRTRKQRWSNLITSSIAAHNHQPSTPNKSNPAEISEFKAARRGFFCLSSDGRTCLYSSFAGTPPHRWECRAGSYSSFRTALISPDIIPFLHNGRKGHKK